MLTIIIIQLMNQNPNFQDQILKGYINSIFDKYDTDKNGTLDPQELTFFFNDLFKQLGINMHVNDQQSMEAIKSIDENGDGVVDKTELFHAFKKLLEAPPPQQNCNNYYNNYPPQPQYNQYNQYDPYRQNQGYMNGSGGYPQNNYQGGYMGNSYNTPNYPNNYPPNNYPPNNYPPNYQNYGNYPPNNYYNQPNYGNTGNGWNKFPRR